MGKRAYWTTYPFLDWTLIMAAVDGGLCYLAPEKEQDHFSRWMDTHFSHYDLVNRKAPFQECITWLEAYCRRENDPYTGKLYLEGTSFQREVWQTLLEIPFGHTLSYSQLAQKLGRPKGARAVAQAIGANPLLIIIPCHRVIAKDGSLAGYRGGLEMKRKLLSLEGWADL